MYFPIFIISDKSCTFRYSLFQNVVIASTSTLSPSAISTSFVSNILPAAGVLTGALDACGGAALMVTEVLTMHFIMFNC